MSAITFGSVCSGIEAASVAWHPLGWRAAWLSEIEAFPSAVLAHHYPDVPNLGDMTTIAARVLAGEVPAPDVLCGGTPCQAFSVAGKRESLADDRGNLTLKFVELANAIDHVRAERGEPECVVVWENVPGVLSTKDNAFGCFLAGLAGEDEPLQPPGQKWWNAGAVYGPKRAVAWRTLDAQYFGLAQRRKRVFVVASARKGLDPPQVLFEWDGLRRDTAPGREARQTAPTIPARSTAGGGLGTDFDCDGGVIQAPSVQVCPTLRAGGNQTGGDRPPVTDVDTADSLIPVTTHTLRGEGFDASEDGTGRGTPLVPVAFAENSRSEIRLEGGDGQRTGALSTGGGKPGQGVPMIAFPANLSGTQCASTENLSPALGAVNPTAVAGMTQTCYVSQHSEREALYNKGFNTLQEGNASTQETDPGTLLRTLRQEVGEEAFAKWGLGILDSLQQAEVLRQALHGFSIRPASFSRSWVVCCALGFPVYGSGWLLQSLREAGCERCSSQGWEPSEQLAGELGAYLSELSRPGAQAARFLHDLWQASQGLGVLRQALSAVQEVGRPAGRQGQSILGSSSGRVEAHFFVRRLTVEECEFLQGFPRGYSKIPWRGKPADQCPDGPRYRALGNSWAVPVARWVGRRINDALAAAKP